MGTFTESALLRVEDQSTGPIRKINSELEKLFQTAGKLKSLKIDLNINAPRNVSRTIQDLDRLSTALNRVNSANLSGIGNISGHLRSLASALNAPISTRGLTTALNRINSINLSNLGSVTSQIRTLAGAIHSLNNATGSMRGGRLNVPTMPPGSAPPIGRPQQSSGLFGRAGFSPNASVSDRIQNRLVGGIESNIGKGHESSGAARDYARLAFPNEPGVASASERFAQEQTRRFPSISFGTAMNTWLETAATVKPDSLKDGKTIQSLNAIVGDMLATAVQGQLLGANPDKSVDGLFKLVKGLNLRGDFTDTAGNLNSDAVKESLGTIRKAQAYAKTELPHESVFQALKYARTSRGTMDQNQLFHLLVGASDVGGSSAGVGQQSFINQLMGQATKEAQKVQAEHGLIKGNIDPNSPAGPKKFAWESTPDSDLLWENNRQFIFRKFMQGQDGEKSVLEQMGVDWKTAKPAELASKLKPMFSNRVALDHLMHTITQYQEAENALARGQLAATSPGAIRAKAKESGRLHGYGVSKAMETFWGEWINATSAVTNPVMKKITQGMQSLTPKDDDGSLMTGAKMAGLGVLGAGALAANNLGSVAMGIAATAHFRAAGALTAAAGALSMRGLTGGVVGPHVMTPGGVAGGASRPGILAGMRQNWQNTSMLGKGLAGVGAVSGLAGLASGDYLSGAGMLAMTAGGFMSGPLGWAMMAGGALALFGPMLKDFLFGTAAQAQGIAKDVKTAEQMVQDAVASGKVSARDADGLDYIDKSITPYVGESKAEYEKRKADATKEYLQFVEKLNLQRTAQTGAEADHDADGMPTARAMTARAEREAKEAAAQRTAEAMASIELPEAKTPEQSAQRVIDLKDRIKAVQDAINLAGNQFGDGPSAFEGPKPGGDLPWWQRWNPISSAHGATFSQPTPTITPPTLSQPTPMGTMDGFTPPMTAPIGADIRAAFSDSASQISSAGAAAGGALSTGVAGLPGAGEAASAGWYSTIVSAGSAAGAAMAAQVSAAVSNISVNVNTTSNGPAVGRQQTAVSPQ